MFSGEVKQTKTGHCLSQLMKCGSSRQTRSSRIWNRALQLIYAMRLPIMTADKGYLFRTCRGRFLTEEGTVLSLSQEKCFFVLGSEQLRTGLFHCRCLYWMRKMCGSVFSEMHKSFRYSICDWTGSLSVLRKVHFCLPCK